MIEQNNYIVDDFYSHTSYEVRHNWIGIYVDDVDFYSHTSYEVRHYVVGTHPHEDISTHTPHTRCDCNFFNFFFRTFISTHTPHTRCDGGTNKNVDDVKNFYSHTSYEVRHYNN